MSEVKVERKDSWFGGRSAVGPNGGPDYFICMYLDDMHYDEETGEYGPYCKHNNVSMKDKVCSLDCDQYGYCRTCRGFSAIRCQDCDIPRIEK